MSFSNDVVAIEAVTMWRWTEQEKNEDKKLPAVYVHLMMMMMIGVSRMIRRDLPNVLGLIKTHSKSACAPKPHIFNH